MSVCDSALVAGRNAPSGIMSKPLENLLRRAGLLTERQLQRSLEQARRRNVPLIDIVLRDENVPEDVLADAFSTSLNIPRVRVAAAGIDPEAARKLPEKIARKYTCLPLSIEGTTLVLAMANPSDFAAIQDVEFSSSLKVRPVVATYSEVTDAIEAQFDPEDRIGSFIANIPDVTDLRIVDSGAKDVELDADYSRSAAEVAPVVKMCNLLISDAIKFGASDLHVEPALNDVQVRIRVDGVLRDYTHLPKWIHGPLVSRLKILAKLDIAERRLPQDGRVAVSYQGKSLDLRVSTLPMNFGEKVVLRVLGGGSLPSLAKLGLTPSAASLLESAVAQPQGMILITGPTGSGKTTTLYAMLNHRRSPEVNIVTIEDPIEYQLPGINQVQINTRAGLTFAGVLRSILRQDPDVILVGETRDQETAEVAFQAAMTGHLVLSTLHTNSAIATITRLYDLGLDPNILSSSLTLIVAQRLVRRICDQCRERIVPEPELLDRLGLTPRETMPMFRGRGCPACGQTGYSGRTGVYEFLKPTQAIRRLIHDRAGEAELAKAARQAHIKLLRADAFDKIRDGITTPEEVLRVVQLEEEDVRCPKCHKLVQANFATCPFCLHSLRTLCHGCGRELSVEWRTCPFCNSNGLVQSLAEPIGPADDALANVEVAPAPVEAPAVFRMPPDEPSSDWYPSMRVVDFDLAPPAPNASELLIAQPSSAQATPTLSELVSTAGARADVEAAADAATGATTSAQALIDAPAPAVAAPVVEPMPPVEAPVAVALAQAGPGVAPPARSETPPVPAPPAPMATVPEEVPVVAPPPPMAAEPEEVPVVAPPPVAAKPEEVPVVAPPPPMAAEPEEVPVVAPPPPMAAEPEEVPVVAPPPPMAAKPEEVPVVAPPPPMAAKPEEVPVVAPPPPMAAEPEEVPVVAPPPPMAAKPEELPVVAPPPPVAAMPEDVPVGTPARPPVVAVPVVVPKPPAAAQEPARPSAPPPAAGAVRPDRSRIPVPAVKPLRPTGRAGKPAVAAGKPGPAKPRTVGLDEVEELLREMEGVTPESSAAAPSPAPAVSTATPVPPARPAPGPGPRAGATDTRFTVEAKRLRVLVVDDDEDIKEVVRLTLQRLPIEMDIDMASDGVEAIEKANARPPDLVILDIMMPRLDGFETCKQLRRNLRTAFVPILMLTASADETSRTKGYLVGTDDYMGKPFHPIDLNLRVSRLLRRTYGILSPAIG